MSLNLCHWSDTLVDCSVTGPTGACLDRRVCLIQTAQSNFSVHKKCLNYCVWHLCPGGLCYWDFSYWWNWTHVSPVPMCVHVKHFSTLNFWQFTCTLKWVFFVAQSIILVKQSLPLIGYASVIQNVLQNGYGSVFLLIKSEDSRTGMFVPITDPNLRDVLHITKTVHNYAHLMWAPWLNFVQLKAALQLQHACKICTSHLPLSKNLFFFPSKSGAWSVKCARDGRVAVMKNSMWQKESAWNRFYDITPCTELIFDV